MPGYPLIDKSNEYLMSRYDKAVLDAKPWCAAQQQLQENGDELPNQGPTLSPENSQLSRLEVRSPASATATPSSELQSEY